MSLTETTEPAVREGVSPRNYIVRVLRRDIERGVLSVGDPFPSERSLTERFGVARNTVRAAMDELAGEGWLSESPGAGRRNRRVRASASPIGAAIAQDTVVVLGRARTESNPAHRHAGWADFVDFGAQEAIEQRGLHLLVFNPAKLAKDFAALSEQRVYGVLIPSGLSDAADWRHVRKLADAGTPVVVFGEEPDAGPIDRVVSEHEQGAYDLTHWLLERGCRRPQMVWCPESRHAWARSRRAGYERAMADAGLTALPSIVAAGFAPDGETTDPATVYEIRARYLAGYLASGLLGDQPADAILAPTDGEAFALAGACARLGRKPNRDVLIAGYDDYWEDCPEREFAPCGPAVTVDKQNPLIGAEMVRLLMDRAGQNVPAAAQTRRVPQRLVVT